MGEVTNYVGNNVSMLSVARQPNCRLKWYEKVCKILVHSFYL